MLSELDKNGKIRRVTHQNLEVSMATQPYGTEEIKYLVVMFVVKVDIDDLNLLSLPAWVL